MNRNAGAAVFASQKLKENIRFHQDVTCSDCDHAGFLVPLFWGGTGSTSINDRIGNVPASRSARPERLEDVGGEDSHGEGGEHEECSRQCQGPCSRGGARERGVRHVTGSVVEDVNF